MMVRWSIFRICNKQRIMKEGRKMTMFEYCKMILRKLAFNGHLFRKEYKKAFRYLTAAEQIQLRQWVRATFLQSPKSPNQIL